MGWLGPCVCRARPWPPHMAELPCWGARGSAIRRRFALLSVFPLVFGAFLEAPKSYERDSRTVAKLSPIRTQRSLFRRIQRSFDPPNTSKRRRISPKRAVGDPKWGPLPITGARPWDGRASASAGLSHGRPTWPSSPVGGLGGRPFVVGSLFLERFLGFRGSSRSFPTLRSSVLNRCEALSDTDATVLVS